MKIGSKKDILLYFAYTFTSDNRITGKKSLYSGRDLD